MASNSEVITCSRCQAKGHRASQCSLPFLRQQCSHCQKMGHSEDNCKFKLLAKRAAATAKTEIDRAAWKERRAARQQRWEQCAEADDAKSEVSVSTLSTAATWTPGTLSADEEREARKIEKKLREIAALESRLANGDHLEKLQMEKLGTKEVLMTSLVMSKIKVGFSRPDLRSTVL
eukprot:TRINITY_DN109094_c0_g1_i1.p1 TRINITY_DN109094_c0_g1~~TRINITY_DN109094_c0_g1_i1.p1  ORF type:complete len:176 (+),score=46.40 TRINITY_DN109094_c0_g1_i1:80-607(+)